MGVMYEKKDDEHVERVEKLLIDKQQLLINKTALEAERDNLNLRILEIDQILKIMTEKKLA